MDRWGNVREWRRPVTISIGGVGLRTIDRGMVEISAAGGSFRIGQHDADALLCALRMIFADLDRDE